MITTVKSTTGQDLHTTSVAAPVAPIAASTAAAVPENLGNRGLPYAIGALLGLLVVLVLGVWAYLMLTGGDYSGVIDLTQALPR